MQPIGHYENAMPMIEDNGTKAQLQHRESRPLTILLVDDNAHVIRSIKRLLGPENVYCADSVASAITQIGTLQRLDLAFIDFELPDGSGLEVLEQLKREHPRARRVLMSGGFEAARLGPNRAPEHVFMAKPLDPEAVLELVAQAVVSP